MGVPKFYRWLSERYACLSQVVKDYQARMFSCCIFFVILMCLVFHVLAAGVLSIVNYLCNLLFRIWGVLNVLFVEMF